MKLNQLKLHLNALIGIFFLASCGGGSNKEKAADASDEFDAAKKQIAADVSQIFQDLPPPSEVPYLLMQAGADLNLDVINNISQDKMAAYQANESTAALNLGIYATDIGYLVSYDEADMALDYMGQCQKLAAPVGVADAIDYGMISRFESNMEKKDTLASIINEVIEKSGDRLGELEEINSAGLLLAGSWIEGIYISTQIVQGYPEELDEEVRNIVLADLVKVVMDQKESLNDLIKILNDVPGNAEIDNIISQLQGLKAIYDGELAEVQTKIAENTGDFVLTPSTLDGLAEEVSKIRASIIEI